MMIYDAIVIGGGPAGATAAWDLARSGAKTLLLDRAGRIKPCGGAIPPRCIEDFGIPASLLVAKANAARMVGPSGRHVDMAIEGGFVGMVDRGPFDEWLRVRATEAGADRATGIFESFERLDDGGAVVRWREGRSGALRSARTRLVVGADGAKSAIARQALGDAGEAECVFAYHEMIESPCGDWDDTRADIYYEGKLSPDFYAWIFPHGPVASVGVGSARKGFSMRGAVSELRDRAGLSGQPTVRCEGAPIPMKPLKRWDDRRCVILAGDAAGVVAPASGEGIYYAMLGGRLAADAASAFLASGNARKLGLARKRFMAEHGRVFWVLGLMQKFWYSSDKRRERFVRICEDPDVQYLTWQAYMHKKLVRARHAAHLRIFMKDMGHLLGLASA